MKEQVSQWLVFLALTGVVAGVILSCRVYDDRIELEKNVIWRYYSIDPDTILKSLVQGNTDVFTLLAAIPEGELPNPEKSVLWSQEDFLLVAQTIHEQTWGEPLGDQNLYNMSFDVDCADAEREAFSHAGFESFKVIQTESEEETRMEFWISIWPEIDLVYTVEAAYQPNVNYKAPIAVSQYQVTAGEALQIAERNGGEQARLGVDNACKITALTPASGDRGWRILYQDFPHFDKLLFEIAIDPRTGEYRIIYPKPK